jgi:hypothetical protein
MMGEQKSEPELFNYAVNLEKRVRSNYPLRRVKAAIDFGFVREEVAHCCGKKGNESVAPEVILKMMFLLFFDDIKSERELMEVIGERLDYLTYNWSHPRRRPCIQARIVMKRPTTQAPRCSTQRAGIASPHAEGDGLSGVTSDGELYAFISVPAGVADGVPLTRAMIPWAMPEAST